MKCTAIAHANIAFIKYWGKKQDEYRIPYNDSLSLNISGAYTTTTVEVSPTYTEDVIGFIDAQSSESEINRVKKQVDLIRSKAKKPFFAKVLTQNSIPKGIGAASSASGFAALTLAASAAFMLKLSEKELTKIARLGSGSACRSIPDGFVLWHAGNSHDDSYAQSLHPHTYWDICDILVVVDNTMKKVSTTDGMDGVTTSPFFQQRLVSLPQRLQQLKQSLEDKDFSIFGHILESESYNMHAVMLTQEPSLLYWQPATVAALLKVRELRTKGILAFATIDAGPNVHVICQAKDETIVLDAMSSVSHKQLLVNYPAGAARLISDHLF